MWDSTMHQETAKTTTTTRTKATTTTRKTTTCSKVMQHLAAKKARRKVRLARSIMRTRRRMAAWVGDHPSNASIHSHQSYSSTARRAKSATATKVAQHSTVRVITTG